MTVAGFDRVPLAGPILEPTPPFRRVRAVLGVPSAALQLMIDPRDIVGAQMLVTVMVGGASCSTGATVG